MHVPGILTIALVLLFCVVVSGCTSDIVDGLVATPTPIPTIAQTTVPVKAPVTKIPTITVPTPSPVTTTEPIQKVPREQQVDLVLTKDRPTSEIHLLYQGGPGDIFVTRIMMRVYSSDSVFTEYIMSRGSKPIPNDEIVAPGTRGGDRCEVFVISSGTRYKVMDEKVYGGMYY
jgi:hypothetical protein